MPCSPGARCPGVSLQLGKRRQVGPRGIPGVAPLDIVGGLAQLDLGPVELAGGLGLCQRRQDSGGKGLGGQLVGKPGVQLRDQGVVEKGFYGVSRRVEFGFEQGGGHARVVGRELSSFWIKSDRWSA
jgi:hypothetical protein